jgi:hypothetical protein
MFIAPDPNNIIYGSPGHSGMPGPRGFTNSEYVSFLRKEKINKIFTKIGKKSNLDPGYVFAPYILQTTTTPIIIDGGDKSYLRKSRINRLLDLGFEITSSNSFMPKKLISSRYSVATINTNYYKRL